MSADLHMSSDLQKPLRAVGFGQAHPVGAIIAGKYRIEACVGRGGMGAVYKATDLLVGRLVALKVLLPAYQPDDLAVKRFQREARAIGRLQHPNIITIYDFSVDYDSQPFLVMDYLEGETLSDMIKHNVRLEWRDCVAIFSQVCSALSHAHENNVLHRDIKPSNIWVTTSSGGYFLVKILDFGLAQVLESAEKDNQHLTKTGQLFGSPLYMSPEQAVGKVQDRCSDIYSLGCALYEALTGMPPFAGDTAIATILCHQNDQALSLTEASLGLEFPLALNAIVQKMIAKKAVDRYQSAADLQSDLDSLLDTNLSSTAELTRSLHLANAVTVAEPAFSRKSNKLWKISTIALLLVIGTLFMLWEIFHQGKFNHQTAPELASSSSSAVNVAQPSYQAFSPGDDALYGGLPSSFDKFDHSFQEEVGTQKYLDDRGVDILKLRLKGDVLTDRAFRTIAKFKQLQDLNLGDTKFTDKGYGFRGVVDLPLRKLTLTHSTISTIGLRQICQNKTLEKLRLDSTLINDESLRCLNSCSNLGELDLDDSVKISDDGLRHLTGMKSLRMLTLMGNSQLTGSGLSMLRHMPSLATLDLSDTGFSDRSAHLLLGAEGLNSLSLNNTRLTDKGLKFISRLPNLKKLSLERTDITDAGLLTLKHCTSLSTLDVRFCARLTSSGLNVMKKSKNITKFDY